MPSSNSYHRSRRGRCPRCPTAPAIDPLSPVQPCVAIIINTRKTLGKSLLYFRDDVSVMKFQEPQWLHSEVVVSSCCRSDPSNSKCRTFPADETALSEQFSPKNPSVLTQSMVCSDPHSWTPRSDAKPLSRTTRDRFQVHKLKCCYTWFNTLAYCSTPLLDLLAEM